MRTLPVVLLVLFSLQAQAKRLSVRLLVSPGRVIIQHLCLDMAGANISSALLPDGANTFVTPVERRFPGSVSVSVSGGVPPYRYDWHGLGASASTCSVMPGMVRVSVTDAAGNTVTKTAHVGSMMTTLPSPCGNVNVPLVDLTRLKRAASGDIYFGSAKPRYRSTSAARAGQPGGQLVRPELRTVRQYVPPGPPQGGGGTKPVVLKK